MCTGQHLLFVISLILLSKIPANDSSRILCIYHVPSISHHATFKALTRELTLRGHEVVSVTPFPIQDKSLRNLTEIDTSYVIKIAMRYNFPSLFSKERSVHSKIKGMLAFFEEYAEAVFKDEKFRKIYTDPNQKFDLIISQIYISPIMYSLSAKLKAPIIGVSSMGGWNGAHVAIGNPNPPALYCEMYVHYNGDLTFYERIKSTVYFLWSRLYLHFVAVPRANAIARKYLGEDLPYLADIERNVSALFLSMNPVLYTPRPMVPTVIPISFMHVIPPKPIPQDILKELDRAKNGFIYFGLGSNVQSVSIPERIRNIFLEAFAELPYKVLWKYEGDELPGKPKNIVIRKWMPQQDILAHPNAKVLVYQGGLQSTEEAIDREVPMVGIPFISEQEMNLKGLVKQGVAIWIDYLNMTKEELVRSIIEVAENPRYRENVKKLKKLLKDEPMSGMEKAMWWTDYVIRHKGTAHLRSPTVDIEWHKYLLLDVFAVLIGGALLGLFIIVQILRFLLKNLIRSNSTKSKVKKS